VLGIFPAIVDLTQCSPCGVPIIPLGPIGKPCASRRKKADE
jgi:hypothetical protein